ncbi:MAG: hypothetical protein ACKVOU_15065 [Cytophagales bacterium]
MVSAAPIRCSYVAWNADSLRPFNMMPDTITKSIPRSILTQTSIALSAFPELNEVKIVFQFTNGGAALETMPSFWSVFKKPAKRTYYISIANKTDKLFEPILLKNLSYDAQIGVLAHELSHVSDFQQFNFINFVVHAIKYTINGSYGDSFEYNTDMICIQHGMGFQLLAWSTDTRLKLDLKKIMEKYKFDITRERYMHPESIKKAINTMKFYQNATKPCY